MSQSVFDGLNVHGRADLLAQIARSADMRLKSLGGGHRILIVPEYTFTEGGDLLCSGDKHQIYRRLEGISAQYPDLIIIAGTIAYQKGNFKTRMYSVCPILYKG